MLTTAHLLAGATIGVALVDPILIIPVAFAAHYILDIVPHYAPDGLTGFKEGGFKASSWAELLAKGLEPIIGIALTIALISFASPKLKLPIAVGALFCWLPDIIHFIDWKFDLKQPKLIKHLERRYHMTKYHQHVGGLLGFLPQSALTIVCLFFLLAKIT